MSDQPSLKSVPGADATGDDRPLPAATVPPTPAPPVEYWTPTTRRRRFGVYAAVAAAILTALAAGVIWHEPIAQLFGRHSHGGKADAGGDEKLWTCGMHPQVIREEPGICPICHMKLEPMDVVKSGKSAMGGGSAEGGGAKVAYWWDPMIGPSSISDKPGKSAMGMDLVPVEADAVSAGTAVTIDPAVVQNMGVRVAEVTRGPVRRDVRAVGYLTEAQPLVRDVNLRVSGWVEKLYADTEGKHLNKGDPLFDLYSPEVQVAVGELVAARKSLASLGPAPDELARTTANSLLDSARRKLGLWGLDPEQVERMAKLDEAPRTVTFTSPITGHVTRKMIVEGAAVKAGDMVIQIVDHSTLWLDAQVHAQDLSFVRLGQKVSATVEGFPGKRFDGEVAFVHPHVDPQTRTATVRMVVPNPQMTLRPGMFATAHTEAKIADDALLVPREAVIDTGTRQIAFVAIGKGHFQPRKLKLGVEGDDGTVQVLEGLAPGDTVVTSGQFLLDAESRTREAIEKHLSERLLTNASPGKNKMPAAAPMDGEMKPSTSAPTPTRPGMAAERMKWSAEVDQTFDAYLSLQKVLGAPQPAGAKPVDVVGLIQAAQSLSGLVDGNLKPLPQAVLAAASALRDKPLDEQRALFKPLSDAMIALADSRPPSKAVADKLHVAFCPMAFKNQGGHWLQDGEVIANPYYPTSMKRCGELKRAVETVAAK